MHPEFVIGDTPMNVRSIFATFAIIYGLAACDGSSSDASPGAGSPDGSQATGPQTAGPSASDVAGLWYSTSVDSSGPSIVTSHTYLRLSANQSLEKKVYRVAVDPDSMVTIDSSTNGSTWRLVGDKFIAILQFERVLPPDTFRVSLPAGSLVLEQISDGKTSTTVYRRVGAIVTPAVPKGVQLEKIAFTLGSQEQNALPSLLSIRKNGTLYIKDLDAASANAENIDLIFYEDFNTVTKKYDVNSAHLWSPDAFASDSIWKTSKLATTYLGGSAGAISTRFAHLKERYVANMVTIEDLDDAILSATSSEWKTDINVETGDWIAINASGTYAVAKVRAATAVSTSSSLSASDNIAVNVELLVYTKK